MSEYPKKVCPDKGEQPLHRRDKCVSNGDDLSQEIRLKLANEPKIAEKIKQLFIVHENISGSVFLYSIYPE